MICAREPCSPSILAALSELSRVVGRSSWASVRPGLTPTQAILLSRLRRSRARTLARCERNSSREVLSCWTMCGPLWKKLNALHAKSLHILRMVVLVGVGNEEVLEFYKSFGLLPRAIRLEQKTLSKS
jgi:hypothetical protein